MNVILILTVILLLFSTIVGDEKGIRMFFILVINFAIMFYLISRISYCNNPVAVTLFGCFIMSCITVISLNGINKKTLSTLVSVLIMMIFMLIPIYYFSRIFNINGMDILETESIEYLSVKVDVSFRTILICEMIIGVFSAVTDTAITISSSLYELSNINKSLSRNKLYLSALGIGKDILGTSVNTLFFVYFGNIITILIWFYLRETPAYQIVNSKLLSEIVFDVVISSISIILVIPVSAFVSSFLYTSHNKEKQI